jgi:hypothetical protein
MPKYKYTTRVAKIDFPCAADYAKMRSLDNRSTANFDERRSGTVWTALSPGAQTGVEFSGFHRDVAQPGSALAWGARGREFKSRRPDQ